MTQELTPVMRRLDAPTVTSPQPSRGARLFAVRVRVIRSAAEFIRGIDFVDVLTVVALTFLFIGLAAPSWAFGVIGGLLTLLTPIGTALRILIRGR